MAFASKLTFLMTLAAPELAAVPGRPEAIKAILQFPLDSFLRG